MLATKETKGEKGEGGERRIQNMVGQMSDLEDGGWSACEWSPERQKEGAHTRREARESRRTYLCTFNVDFSSSVFAFTSLNSSFNTSSSSSLGISSIIYNVCTRVRV